MKNNEKGLSTIVATLIIILLVLVATGIIWVVVRNVIQGGSRDVELNAMCLESQVEATHVTIPVVGNPALPWETNALGNSTYRVTLSRIGGSDKISGVVLEFTDQSETVNYLRDIPGDIPRLGILTKDITVPASIFGVNNATKVNVVVYFDDDNGVAQLCQATNSLQF
jgi:hypothetical protein